jgi:hypothetical protein
MFSTLAGSFSQQSAAAFQLAFVGFIIILDIVDEDYKKFIFTALVLHKFVRNKVNIKRKRLQIFLLTSEPFIIYMIPYVGVKRVK